MATWVQMNIQEQWFDTNGDPLSGGVLKVYDPGGLVSTSIAIDSSGSSPQASITLNANGQYSVGGSKVLPYIDRIHKWGIFANATDAAADTPFFAGPFDDVPLGVKASTVTNQTQPTYAALDAALAAGDYVSGDSVTLASTATPEINGQWTVFPIGSYVANVGTKRTGGSFAAVRDGTEGGIMANWFSETSLAAPADSSVAINAAIATITPGQAGGGIVKMAIGLNYQLDLTVTVPANITLDLQKQRMTYTGTGKAFILGGNISSRSVAPKVINANILLSDKDSIGFHALCTQDALVEGYIEGTYTPYDNTRTNIATLIDGGNASSFFNTYKLTCNHIHESFKIESSGSSFATNQRFENCSVFGDHATDTTSKGYNFTNTSGQPEGQGSLITGGNVESCETGIHIGAQAGTICMSGVRFEAGSNTTDVRFEGTSAQAHTIIGCSDIDVSKVVIDQPSVSQVVIFNDDGSLGRETSGQTIKNRMFLNNGASGTFRILTPYDNTATGAVALQCGSGSGTYGGGFAAYAGTHATYPGGSAALLADSSAIFRVNGSGVDGGSDRFRVGLGFVTPGADNVSTCGSASYRFTELFSVNATINTSDARFKTKVKPLTPSEIAASKEILQSLGGWQWLAKVEKEGDDARIHYGTTVQSAIKILEAHGIDATKQSFICYDKWEDQYSWRSDDGEEWERVLIKEAGDQYSFRSCELIMFLLAGISARLDAAGI